MYLSPRRTLSSRASGCLITLGWSRLSAGAGSSCTYAGPGITPGTAERGSSGGLVGMFGTFPSAGSDLWIRPLLEETALPSLRTKLFVRSPRSGGRGTLREVAAQERCNGLAPATLRAFGAHDWTCARRGA